MGDTQRTRKIVYKYISKIVYKTAKWRWHNSGDENKINISSLYKDYTNIEAGKRTTSLYTTNSFMNWREIHTCIRHRQVYETQLKSMVWYITRISSTKSREPAYLRLNQLKRDSWDLTQECYVLTGLRQGNLVSPVLVWSPNKILWGRCNSRAKRIDDLAFVSDPK